MNRSTPWEEIPIPGTGFNVIRVLDVTGVPTFWGRDSSSQCLLIIELSGDVTTQFRRQTTKLHGISIDLRNGESAGMQRVVLALARHIDVDLFFGLCNTLIARLNMVSNSETAVEVIFSHLKRWKAFLASGYNRIMSPEEIKGLFGELHTLRTLYRGTLSQEAAIEAWSGPSNAQQDFLFGNRAIEVKSLSTKERGVVHISSEDQLESFAEHLYLLTLRLTEAPDDNYALSLNGMISLIESELSNPVAIESFLGKIASTNYLPLTEYDKPQFLAEIFNAYRIIDDFPRLVRSSLPDSIMKVRYDIKLESIASYACQSGELFRRI